MKNKIIESLKVRGLDITTKKVYKNGVELEGITIQPNGVNSICPIIYFDDIAQMLMDKSYGEVIDELENILVSTEAPKFSLKFLDDRECFLSHIYVGMQRASEQDIVKRPCEEMDRETELYLYIRDDTDNDGGFFSCKVNKPLLDRVDCSEEDAWASAIHNTCEESTLIGMSQMLFGEESDDEYIYILTNKLCVNGASSIINRGLLERFAKEKGVDRLIVIPSSTDELLIIPTADESDEENLADIVKSVNEEAVEPRKRLAERPYTIAV